MVEELNDIIDAGVSKSLAYDLSQHELFVIIND